MPRLGFNFFGELMNFDSLLSQWNNNFHDSDEADGKMYGNHDVHSSDKVDGHVRIDDDDAGLPLAEWLWVKTAECRKKVLFYTGNSRHVFCTGFTSCWESDGTIALEQQLFAKQKCKSCPLGPDCRGAEMHPFPVLSPTFLPF